MGKRLSPFCYWGYHMGKVYAADYPGICMYDKQRAKAWCPLMSLERRQAIAKGLREYHAHRKWVIEQRERQRLLREQKRIKRAAIRLERKAKRLRKKGIIL
jgi:hypothetical protein